MAGFCRNCGSPLDDGQRFCAKCGTPASGPPVRSTAPSSSAPSSAPRSGAPPEAAPQPRPPAPAPAAQAAATTPSKSGSTLVKVLLIFLVVIFILGAASVAGIWYVAHRVKQKVHEIGLDDLSTASNANREPALGGSDPCRLLSKADVGQAAKVEVIRAEADPGSEPGCVYSVQGDISDLVAKHASLLHREATTEAQRKQFESVAKGLFQGMDTEQSGSASKHPGEAPVFTFSVTNRGAKAQMNFSRMTFGRMGGGTVTIPDLGDDNLDIGGAMMLVQKGDKLVRVMYMMCPCATDDVVPLVKKLIANL
jgi:hypothetical protein